MGRRTVHLDLALGPILVVGAAGVEALHLAVEVSEDGDRVHRCALVLEGAHRELAVRRHSHLLAELAEARRGRRADGWVEASVVQRRLDLSTSLLHLYTHRARAQVRKAGLPEGHDVIEVRGERGARQLRLGVAARVIARS